MVILSRSLMERLSLKSEVVSQEDLDNITILKISKNDLPYLKNFRNLASLELDTFPSITNDDIDLIASSVPQIISIKIKEQNALFEIDFSKFKNLEEVCVIHNDNLINIKGLEKVDRFTFYDNKECRDIEEIIDIVLNNRNATIVLDIIYYIDIVRHLLEINESVEILKQFKWVESVGLRKFKVHEYTEDEVDSLLENVTSVVSKYIYVTDGDIEKFGVLYRWMIDNIKFINEDDPHGENPENVSNIYKVFKYRKGGRLSFAKAFQLLLSFAGVSSNVVYSLGALDLIGYYNGKRVYSLLGKSDYSVLRVVLEGRIYYCDLAWDSLVKSAGMYNELKLFLISKEELKIRHNLVGEGNVTESYSYNDKYTIDLINFALERITDVDEIFKDIDRVDPKISGVQLNQAVNRKKISILEKQLNEVEKDSERYRDLQKELEERILDDKEYENDLYRLNNQRKGIIESYIDTLKNRYIENMDTKEEVLNKLELMNDMYILSDYMFDILYNAIKTA